MTLYWDDNPILERRNLRPPTPQEAQNVLAGSPPSEDDFLRMARFFTSDDRAKKFLENSNGKSPVEKLRIFREKLFTKFPSLVDNSNWCPLCGAPVNWTTQRNPLLPKQGTRPVCLLHKSHATVWWAMTVSGTMLGMDKQWLAENIDMVRLEKARADWKEYRLHKKQLEAK